MLAVIMKYLVVLLLLVTMPLARAEVSPDDVKKLVEASRLDLNVLSFRLTVSEANNRIARGMPTEKLARIFRDFAGKLDIQAIYRYSVQELAESLEQKHLAGLMECFTSDFMSKYHFAQYQRLTKQGAQAFRDQLVPLDLGISEPDPDRMEIMKPLQSQYRNPEIWLKTTKQMFWLINLDMKEKYPMFGRTREMMDEYYNEAEFEKMSGETAKYNQLVSYVMLEQLSDEELTELKECHSTPEMAMYDESTTRGLYQYLLDAEASWVTPTATDERGPTHK